MNEKQIQKMMDAAIKEFENTIIKPMRITWRKPVMEIYTFLKKHKALISIVLIVYFALTYLLGEGEEESDE